VQCVQHGLDPGAYVLEGTIGDSLPLDKRLAKTGGAGPTRTQNLTLVYQLVSFGMSASSESLPIHPKTHAPTQYQSQTTTHTQHHRRNKDDGKQRVQSLGAAVARLHAGGGGGG